MQIYFQNCLQTTVQCYKLSDSTNTWIWLTHYIACPLHFPCTSKCRIQHHKKDYYCANREDRNHKADSHECQTDSSCYRNDHTCPLSLPACTDTCHSCCIAANVNPAHHKHSCCSGHLLSYNSWACNVHNWDHRGYRDNPSNDHHGRWYWRDEHQRNIFPQSHYNYKLNYKEFRVYWQHLINFFSFSLSKI